MPRIFGDFCHLFSTGAGSTLGTIERRYAMTLLKNVLALSLSLTLAAPLLAKPKTVSLADLTPTAEQGEAADWVSKYLTRLHYASKPLDDAMSQEILKRYLDALDGEKVFFLKADIDGFEQRYATTLDDAIETRKLDGVYDIYKIYLKRLQERTEYSRALLKKGRAVGGQQGRTRRALAPAHQE
jgi:carboxyl-terminal processing protease